MYLVYAAWKRQTRPKWIVFATCELNAKANYKSGLPRVDQNSFAIVKLIDERDYRSRKLVTNYYLCGHFFLILSKSSRKPRVKQNAFPAELLRILRFTVLSLGHLIPSLLRYSRQASRRQYSDRLRIFMSLDHILFVVWLFFAFFGT